MQEPQQAIFPEAVKEVSPVKGAASDTDTLTRDFLKKIKGYEHINAKLDRVGVYHQGSIVLYCFSFIENKVTSIEAYWSKYEQQSGTEYVINPFEQIEKAKLGRFLRIKDLSKTEIEFKHLIG